jgi:histidinol-phosphate/aromatic aminotransferase/cobyric acid decarboxylase-like protein
MMSSNSHTKPGQFKLAQRLRGLSPYTPPAKSSLVDLPLDANEGMPLSDSILEKLSGIDRDQLRRYPNTVMLESALASKFEIEMERVVVTNGADDAIDRVCRIALEPGRELLVHTPTFEMIERGARLAGGTVRSVYWLEGDFPVTEMIEEISRKTSLVAIVSPNNPSGSVIPLEGLLEIVHASAGVGAIVMVDLAYIKFADRDPTIDLLEEPNVIIVRTFSKAMGLAGARVGYALASSEVTDWLRIIGGPYPAGSVSLALAVDSLEEESRQQEYTDTIRIERAEFPNLLSQHGCKVLVSQATL